MKSVTFLFILMLSVFKICESSDEECFDNFLEILNFTRRSLVHSRHRIFLLSSRDEEHEKMNTYFHQIAHLLSFKVFELPAFCSNGVEALEIAVIFGFHVIDLKVKLPANFLLYDQLLHGNLTIIGEARNDDPIECSSSDIEYSISTDCVQACKNNTNVVPIVRNEEYRNSCEITYSRKINEYTYSTVISKSLEKYVLLKEVLEHLYEDYKAERYSHWEKYIQTSKLSKKPLTDRTIFVCIDEPREDERFSEPNFHNVRYVKGCERIGDFAEKTVLAALAPKPLKEEIKTYIPTIFHNVPYLLPEHIDTYPHGMTLYGDYFDKLKRGLMELLKLNKWNRIAIVSDDSPYSDAFEADLTELFQKNGVVYAVKQCLERICNFDKALKSLKKDNARIIIANMDEEYAKKLVAAAARQKLTSKSGVMWIWRDWPFPYENDTAVLGDVYSMFLAAEKEISPNSSYDPNIQEGISIIRDTHHSKPNEWEDEDLINETPTKGRMKLHYHEIKQILESRASVFVHLKRISTNSTAIVYTFKVKGRAIEGVLTTDIPFQDAPPDCTFRSNGFAYSCLDVYPLIIMIMLILIILTALGVYFYLDKYANQRRLYRSL